MYIFYDYPQYTQNSIIFFVYEYSVFSDLMNGTVLVKEKMRFPIHLEKRILNYEL